MEKVLSSAQASAEIEKLEARNAELNSKVEEMRSEFENQEIEKREETLDEVESLINEIKANEEAITKLQERKESLMEEEKRMELLKNLETPTVREASNVLDSQEYRNAYAEYLKSGSETEVRALATTTSGIPVPTVMQQYVEMAWEKYGHISRLVTKSYVKGILAVPYVSEADAALYHVEGAAQNEEEDITFAQTLLQPAMIKKWISLTDEVIALTGDEFLRFIADEIVYNVILFLDKQIVTGTGSNGKGVIGIVGAPLTTAVSNELDFNAVNAGLAVLGDEVENPVAIMNKQTFFNGFMGLADVGGMPIFSISHDNAGRPEYFVNGVPAIFTSALPAYAAATANAAWLVVGDLRGYKLNLPEGDDVKLLFDPYTLATQDMQRIVGRLFAAGAVTKPGMLAAVTKPAA